MLCSFLRGKKTTQPRALLAPGLPSAMEAQYNPNVAGQREGEREREKKGWRKGERAHQWRTVIHVP